jgi:hypothetical protein
VTHYHGGTGWQEGGGKEPEHLHVQRYFINEVHRSDIMLPAATNPNLTEPSGDWVLYSEHAAALRACEQRVQADLEDQINLYRRHANEAYQRGLDAAREAVLGAKAIDIAYGRAFDEPARFIWLNNALCAIDALRKDSHD